MNTSLQSISYDLSLAIGPLLFSCATPTRPGASTGQTVMVYIDNMNASYRGMKMCHMIADSTDELLAMADQIGVARKWIQKYGTYEEHFDICQSKKAKAVQLGAKEISMMELGRMLAKRPGHPLFEKTCPNPN